MSDRPEKTRHPKPSPSSIAIKRTNYQRHDAVPSVTSFERPNDPSATRDRRLGRRVSQDYPTEPTDDLPLAATQLEPTCE